MAYISRTLDTDPMARTIDTVSSHVIGTTTAVTAMKAAVIKAEEEAADLVCDNVNKGFYTLIHSQISQKIAKLKSEVDSHLLRLHQLNKQLLSIKSRMGRDYGMISERYITLFNRINRNLENRVYELDKPTITFAVKDISTISNRTKLLTAVAPLTQSESVSTSQRILASNMKYRGMMVIDSTSKFLNGLKEQRELSEHILLDGDVNSEVSEIMIPTVISESNYDKYDNKRISIEVNSTNLSRRVQDSIRNGIDPLSLNWQDEEKIDENIISEFNKYLSESPASERVKKVATELFHSNKFQTTKI